MFGIKTERGWLKATQGATKRFFVFSPTPEYEFRTEAGASAVANDWLLPVGLTFEVRERCIVETLATS